MKCSIFSTFRKKYKFDKLQQTINIKGDHMQEYYLKSLQMIKNLNIKSKKEYNKLLADYLVLSVISLKYYAKTNNFKEILERAKEV